jgi:hypothetical protein
MHGGAAEEAAETATAAKAVAKKRVSVAAAAKVEAISESDEDSGSDSDESISDSDEELDEADKVDSAASSSASSSQQYHYSGPSLDKILHGALKKDEAEGLLMLTTADQPDGAYMLRLREKGNDDAYILSVVHQVNDEGREPKANPLARSLSFVVFPE